MVHLADFKKAQPPFERIVPVLALKGMKQFERLRQISINKPCAADWDSMEGDEVRRFCGRCQKHVHNLSEMEAEAAEGLLAKGPICVRYRRDDRGRMITKTALIAGVAMAMIGCQTSESVENPVNDSGQTPPIEQVDNKPPHKPEQGKREAVTGQAPSIQGFVGEVKIS